jgi:hypothetical protein
MAEAVRAHPRQAAGYAALALFLVLAAYFPGDFLVSSKLMLPQLPITPGYTITSGLGLPADIYAYFNPRQPSELYLSLGLTERLRWAVAREMAATRVRAGDGRLERETRRIAARLQRSVRCNVLRGGLLEFWARGGNPEELRWIVNLYARQYVDNISGIQRSTIVKKRQAIEQRLQELDREQAQLQAEFKAFRAEKGVIAPVEQLGVGVSLIGSLSSALVKDRAQLESLRAGATRDHPDIKRLEREIASLQDQMETLEMEDQKGLLSLQKVSRQSTDYLNLQLRQKHLETLREAFNRALQVTIFEERATDATAVVVDEPIGPPERNLRLWPTALALAVLALVHRSGLGALLRRLAG